MAAMANFFDLSSWPKRFRFVAVLEAISWAGLLIGMAFKYLPEEGPEIGVKIFGPIHGGIFVIYIIVTLFTARALRWHPATTLLALYLSIPPFGTLFFEWSAKVTGQLGELSADSTNAVGRAPAPAR